MSEGQHLIVAGQKVIFAFVEFSLRVRVVLFVVGPRVGLLQLAVDVPLVRHPIGVDQPLNAFQIARHGVRVCFAFRNKVVNFD